MVLCYEGQDSSLCFVSLEEGLSGPSRKRRRVSGIQIYPIFPDKMPKYLKIEKHYPARRAASTEK